MAIRIIRVGERVPEVTFQIKAGAGFSYCNSLECFNKGRFLVLGVPGIFVSDYPSSMLMGYEHHAVQLNQLGIDQIYFTCTNDSYVVSQWMRSQEIKNLLPLPDGNGDWASAIGFLVDMKRSHMGTRSHRYAMIIENQIVKKVFYEDFTHDPHTCFTETNAERVIQYLKENQTTWLRYSRDLTNP